MSVVGDDSHRHCSSGKDGVFVLYACPGEQLELVGRRCGFHDTYTAVITVPEEGITDPEDLPIQMPSDVIWWVFSHILHGPALNPDACQFVVTVASATKTVRDDEQGLAGATASISPDVEYPPHYFGVFLGKTNPFSRNLNATTGDGGALFYNVPVNLHAPYVIRAHKEGIVFSETKMWCRGPGRFVNAPPRMGPTQDLLLFFRKPQH